MQDARVDCISATIAVTQLQNVTRDSKTKKRRHSERFPDDLRAEWKATMSLPSCAQRSRAKKAISNKFQIVLREIKKARDIERLAEGKAITKIIALKPIEEVKKPSVPGSPDAPGFISTEAGTWKTAA